ncbi:MAG: hypothetical protein AABZ30_08305 [Myxococcota bacterium]
MRRLAAVLLAAACGDGTAVTPAPRDGGIAADGTLARDGAAGRDGQAACETLADCAEVACRQGDLDLECLGCAGGICAVCDDAADCLEHAPIWSACTDDARCVECAANADCTGNAGALGPACDALQGFCVCAKDADCAGNPNGGRCVTEGSSAYCGCASGDDCAEGLACGVPGWLDVCRAPSGDGGLATPDASVDAAPPDAAPPAAAPPDAARDATVPDASVDAAPPDAPVAPVTDAGS